VDRANSRTLAQETAAYFDDRRDQSYSATSGLGSLTAAYRAGAGAFTTITARCATMRPPRQPNLIICTRARGDKAWTGKAWPSWLRLPCARRKA
ncbi:autotransporter, partial [Pseudomonas syringae pv. actinidiae ICMP 19079]